VPRQASGRAPKDRRVTAVTIDQLVGDFANEIKAAPMEMELNESLAGATTATRLILVEVIGRHPSRNRRSVLDHRIDAVPGFS
jgi:hypothetical protein